LRYVFMRARSGGRRSRPVKRTGAVLVVLLAALVHLLACAHGPAPVGVGRADSLLVAQASCGQSAGPVGDPASHQREPRDGGAAWCWGHDEPTAQPPRDAASAAAVMPTDLPPQYVGAPAAAPWAAPPTDPRPDAESVGQSRARLGVWRT
ncbi:hypothetical protein ABZZ16_34165, partial [Streptomyces sp. NPDC006386]|uniref:hypothetical protein n=1 Tax=Streptomyces sp. NPDC006386 TaxID=3156762 RepID=UPI0033A31F2D